MMLSKKEKLWIFQEYCELGDLQKYFSKAKEEGINVSDDDKLKMMLDIAKGVEYLHGKNVIHRDIKPNNILLAGVPVRAKLTDFDFSKFLGIDESTMTTLVGTEAFKAPEFFMRTADGELKYKRSVDIFAMGLTFLAMIQENKGLVPKIETPNEPSELHLSNGRILYERIRFKVEPLSVVDQSKGNLLEQEIRRVIDKLTHAVATDRSSAEKVVSELQQLSKIPAEQTKVEQSGSEFPLSRNYVSRDFAREKDEVRKEF